MVVMQRFDACQIPLEETTGEIQAFFSMQTQNFQQINNIFKINPHYCGQYVSPDLYFLVLEVTNNYNPTSLSEGPIES